MPSSNTRHPPSRLEHAIRRDRINVGVSLLIVTMLAWFYLARMALEMGGMAELSDALAPAHPHPLTVTHVFIIFLMWVAMTVGMMLPSASPMILMFANINRKRRLGGDTFVPTGVFVAGYLAVWLAFGLMATLVQWRLQTIGLVSPMMGKAHIALGGSVLIAAGIYQWTPLKDACLRLCQTPLGFLMTRWRDGPAGAFYMGVSHGVYCVGCCWVLMLLMFVGGVMNLLWMALLAVLMLAEKLVPPGHWLPRAAGVALTVWGIFILVSIL